MILLPKFDSPNDALPAPSDGHDRGPHILYPSVSRPDYQRLDARMRLFVSGSAPLSAETHGNGVPAPVTPSWNATA